MLTQTAHQDQEGDDERGRRVKGCVGLNWWRAPELDKLMDDSHWRLSLTMMLLPLTIVLLLVSKPYVINS